MKAYSELRGEFEKFNANLVAVSPEIPDSSLSTKEKDSLQFDVLSDSGNAVAEQFGIVYTLPVPIAEMLGERVAAYNADNSARLPLAVTYVIDTDRVIRYAFVDADYKKRAEPADIVSVLKRLQ